MNGNAKVPHGSFSIWKAILYPYKLYLMEYKLEVKTNMLSTIGVVIAIYNGTLDTRFK